MLKICFIVTKLELGGAQKVALYTAEHINGDEFKEFFITGKGGILDNAAAEKFRIYRLSNFVREISPLKDLKALRHIYGILKTEKPDVVHTHSSKAGILGRIAAKLAGIKIIVHTVHGYSFNETQNFFKKYLYACLEKFCSLFSDKLIAVAKEDIKKGIKYKIAKESKFELIRAGINTDHYKNYTPDKNFKNALGISESTKVVTTIGPFKPQKNLKDFIKAADIVGKKNNDIVFLAAGDGEQRKELENLISELGLKEKILLLGWRNDIAELLYASDIFVMTSLWEGLPCTILEAMCCGKPVIANAVDGVKEIIKEGETGFLIKPYDYVSAAEKINYLLNDNILLLKMGENAKDSITKEFDINYTVTQHEELYKRLGRN
ncbi:MAG: glycosyltransferase family 4 protein [Endomicrobia bacterium]|nr:glycosyltransferase family 4 protein [Endomicrobiia bacterium]